MENNQSFCEFFKKVAKNDDIDGLARKVQLQATSALSSQIPALKGDRIQLEDNITSALELLDLCIVNHGKPITDRHAYVSALVACQNRKIEAEQALRDHDTLIEFLQLQLNRVNGEASLAVAIADEHSQ